MKKEIPIETMYRVIDCKGHPMGSGPIRASELEAELLKLCWCPDPGAIVRNLRNSTITYRWDHESWIWKLVEPPTPYD